MAVVVTGAAGFVGQHLVGHLCALGHRVVAVDRRPCSGLPTAVTSVVADLVEADLAGLLRDADAVFHLAARAGVRDPRPDIERLRHRDNVLATAAVLAAAPAAVPVVVTSSSSVYGGSSGRGCREGDELRPRGGYARSKVRVEALCAARRAAGGAVAVARPFTVAGEGQRPDMAIARWIDAVSTSRPVHVLGSPARTRDITDVRDVVDGLVRLADRGIGRTVNLGTGVGHTLEQILAAVCTAVGAPTEVQCHPAPYDEVPDTRADTAHCERVLGFRPTTDLADLVQRQVAALPARAVAVPG